MNKLLCFLLLISSTIFGQNNTSYSLLDAQDFALKNHLSIKNSELAIQKSKLGDHSEVATLFKLLQSPFDEQPAFESYAQLPPAWASEIETIYKLIHDGTHILYFSVDVDSSNVEGTKNVGTFQECQQEIDRLGLIWPSVE